MLGSDTFSVLSHIYLGKIVREIRWNMTCSCTFKVVSYAAGNPDQNWAIHFRLRISCQGFLVEI